MYLFLPCAVAQAFYSARTSRCYTCRDRNQPRLTTNADGSQQYAPVDCLARCNPNDAVGSSTVILESRVRRSTTQNIGTAWLT
jgi:hypothetical protein